jgi:phospholipid/cholesterol/gamma-HCH transport system substrate-binding protein
MRRVALIALALVAGMALVANSASGDGNGNSDGDYLVRGYFDNAGFLVNGEDVRIAGASVGSVQEVDIARPGEAVTEDGSEDPGKAVVVMKITDPGFENFLTDASCLIRPQSLLGEKYVDCQPTQPRAPGTAAPPSLEQIPDGDVGAGQYRLPLENNGKSVDLDLINNITRQSESDRFRLILNDLGAGLAARGNDLEEVIKRADPALQETDKVLAQLADQNKQLAQLAADSDTILAPLARERQHLSGFIRNAAIAGQASAERRNDIELGLQRFPAALNQLQLTMVQLRRFAESGVPVARNLEKAAPGLTGATEALRPFSRAGTGALLSLGRAAQASGPDLAASDPVIRDLRTLGEATTPGAKSLKSLLATFRKTKGIDYLMQTLLNQSNVFNGFDNYGHYLRAQLQITNCVEYVLKFVTGCDANWSDVATLGAPAPTKATLAGKGLPGVTDGDWNADGVVDDTDAIIAAGLTGQSHPSATSQGSSVALGAKTASDNADAAAQDDLFNFLTGSGK